MKKNDTFYCAVECLCSNEVHYFNGCWKVFYFGWLFSELQFILKISYIFYIK